MDYKYFTEKERQYIIDCWSSFKNEGNSYRDKIAAFNVDFYNNDFKPNLINIDSYIGNIDDRYYSDSYELKSKINKFLSELNFKDDWLRIAKECFGFDEEFEGFSMDVVNLIDYKFKSNQINTLEDAYNCFKEYNNFTGIDYSLEEYKEMVENEIKELKQNNTYDCSIEQREDILLKLTTNIYKYYSITKRETDFHRMTLKHFNPSEAKYISDVYNEYRIYSRREKHYEGSYYYGDYFLEYFKEENAYLEKNFEERLEKKTFKNPKFEEYYNKIVEIFELEKVFKDTEENKNYFNLLEFKFKVYNEEGVGIYNLEQAYEICKDLSLILGKANAIKVFESCYQLNPNSQNTLSDDNSNFDIESEENINDPHKDKYNAIIKLLKDSITYASHEKIGKIIQYKIGKKPINPTYSKSYFCLSSKVIKNAAKIGMCFELNNNEIRHFIRLLGENNTKKQITGRIPKVDELNATYDLDSILITIRNEYLHEIDPKVFPKIKIIQTKNIH